MSPQELPAGEAAQHAAPCPPSRVLQLLDGFLGVQRERAAAYRRLDTAFRAYLSNSAEGPYR